MGERGGDKLATGTNVVIKGRFRLHVGDVVGVSKIISVKTSPELSVPIAISSSSRKELEFSFRSKVKPVSRQCGTRHTSRG